MLASLALLFSLASHALALGQNATVAFAAGAGNVLLANKEIPATIIADRDDWPGVLRAVQNLALDFGRATGRNGTVSNSGDAQNRTLARLRSRQSGPGNSTSNAAIIVGTIGKSTLIDSLVKAGKIDVSAIQGQWEAYTSAVVNAPLPGYAQALVIAGGDKRGSIYGVYDISEQIGVSPWYYWADAPPQKHDAIYALPKTRIQGSPSVRYRGIFINDNGPAMTGWIDAKRPKAKYGSGYDHVVYESIFELLLRLKANYIWPAGADWGQNFFVDDPKNQPLADEMGIVMGTSHTEPMARSTGEWSIFGKGDWSWSKNKDAIIPFFREGAVRAKPYENVLTMAMRGSGDTALAPTIQTEVLEDIVNSQRQILSEVHNGTKDLSSVPQMWCLYKEVQGYYEAGMKVPDDITLLWADDNWGNIRRLPTASERNRTGGAGVYFHFDYVGGPRNYKWINTVQLQRTWEQMSLAYEREARRIWVVNVGDLKGLEVPMSHFLDLAYDFGRWKLGSEKEWTMLWATREFGQQSAEKVTSLMNTFGKLAARRKFELLDPSVYSVINYEEADRVSKEWSDLADEAQRVYDALDSSAKPAFFQMVLHPIQGGALTHDIHISAAKNNVYALQSRNSANRWADRMRTKLKEDHELTVRWDAMLDGKWLHMMDQTHVGYRYWQQPMRQVLPPVQYVENLERALSGDIGVTVEGMSASIPGDGPDIPQNTGNLKMLPMDPYLAGKRYIELYHTGVQVTNWTINADKSYVKLSKSSGMLGPEDDDEKIYITVDWNSAPAGASTVRFDIKSGTGFAFAEAPSLTLPINKVAVSEGFTGFVESDRTIAMEAEHFTRISGASTTAKYETLPDYGKTLSAMTLLPGTAPSQSAPAGLALEYDFFAFTSSTRATLTIILGSGLNTDPSRPLRFAYAIDEAAPKVVKYITDQTQGRTPLGWETAVSDGVWKSVARGIAVTPGKHTLKFWALEPGVVLQRIVLDVGGVRKSYLGPPESFRITTPRS